MAKINSVELKRRNLITFNYDEHLLKVSPFWFQMQVVIDDPSVNMKLLKVPLEGVVKQCQGEINSQLATLQSRVVALKKKEASDLKVGEKASKDVEKVSRAISGYVNSIRDRICKRTADMTSVKIKDVRTIGSRQFKGAELASGAFKYTIGPDVEKAANSAKKKAQDEINDAIEDVEDTVKSEQKKVDKVKQRTQSSYDGLKRSLESIDDCKSEISDVREYSREAHDTLKKVLWAWTSAAKGHENAPDKAKKVSEHEDSKKAMKDADSELRHKGQQHVRRLKKLKKAIEGNHPRINTALVQIKTLQADVQSLKDAFSSADKAISSKLAAGQKTFNALPKKLEDQISKKVGKGTKPASKAKSEITKERAKADKAIENKLEPYDDAKKDTWRKIPHGSAELLKTKTALSNLLETSEGLSKLIAAEATNLDPDSSTPKTGPRRLITTSGLESWAKSPNAWTMDLASLKKGYIVNEQKVEKQTDTVKSKAKELQQHIRIVADLTRALI